MKTWYKYVGLLLVVVTIGFVVYLCRDTKDEPRDFAEIHSSKVLRVVTDYNQLGYYVSEDTIAGFNHDLLQLFQSYFSDIKIEISVENNLEKCIQGLEEKKYDLIARNITTIEELRNKMSFTQPLVRSKYVLIQRKAMFNDSIEPVREHLNLAKKVIYVPKGSPAKVRLKNLSFEIGDTIYVVEDDVYEATQLAMMVAKGEIDFSVCDEGVAEKIKSVLPEVDMKTDIGFTHLEAWAVRKNSPILLDSLNKWINKIEKTKEYSKIYKKYYN